MAYSVTNIHVLHIFTDIDFYIGCPKEQFYRVALSTKMEEMNIDEWMKDFKGNQDILGMVLANANDVPMEKV